MLRPLLVAAVRVGKRTLRIQSWLSAPSSDQTLIGAKGREIHLVNEEQIVRISQ